MQYLKSVPSAELIKLFYETVKRYLFPIAENEEEYLGIISKLEVQICSLLGEILENDTFINLKNKKEIKQEFLNQLIGVKSMLNQDAEGMYEFDPAAKSVEEVIMTYIGFKAIMAYRVAHVLHKLEVPLVPRMISEMAHSTTGVDIHPGAQIDTPFIIDHATGLVIGETAIIGKNVKLYQGVTIGAMAVEKSEQGNKRHPTIEDGVIVYANSTILGGNTVLGRESVIGGNCFVTSSVAPHSLVYHKPVISVRDKKNFEEPINFVI
jgi:serine O-acetyltransferase